MKDPAFLFYSGDFLTGTALFTYEQLGKYIKLLCHQHQLGHFTMDDINSLVGPVDERIMAKFVLDPDGKYYNERLEFEAVKRKNFVDSRRKNKAGKVSHDPTYEKHMTLHMTQHMTGHMENENRDRDVSVIRVEEKKDSIGGPGGKKGKKEGGVEIEVKLPWDTDRFREAWKYWKEYKWEQHKFRYKGAKSEQGSLMLLAKMSDGIEQVAIDTIHYTAGQTWQGFVRPKVQSSTNGQGYNPKNDLSVLNGL